MIGDSLQDPSDALPERLFPRVTEPDHLGAAASTKAPGPHPLAAFDAERRRFLEHRAEEALRRKQGLWTLAKAIVDGSGPTDLPGLEAKLVEIGATYEELRPIVDQLIAQRDASRRAAEIAEQQRERDEQERERSRAQRAALAADEAARAAELQRVLEATGATPVNLSETSRRLREGSCRQPTILPNENAP